MNLDKFLLILSWIIGIISAAFISYFFSSSMESFDIATYVDYGEEVCSQRGVGSTSYIECDDGYTTDIQTFFNLLSVVIASGIGNIIYRRKFPPFSNTNSGKITYLTILGCTLLVCMTSFFVLLVVGPDFGRYINFAFAAAVAYYAYKYTESLKDD